MGLDLGYKVDAAAIAAIKQQLGDKWQPFQTSRRCRPTVPPQARRSSNRIHPG